MRLAIQPLCLAAALAAALAAPAAAQSFRDTAALNIQDMQLRAREAMANRQAVGVQNQLSSLDAQARTERSLAGVRGQTSAPAIPQSIPQYQGAPPVFIDGGALASIPDDKLAASNARVREAARNHH